MPQTGILFSSLIFSPTVALSCLLAECEALWGLVGDRLGPLPFSHTRYYESEMGPDLNRIFLLFHPLSVSEWPETKTQAMDIENRYRVGENRQVNIDPGLLRPYQLALLSSKNFSHRLPLAEGVFGEVTLLYQKGRFQALPWTYPDYQSPTFLAWLSAARKKYRHVS